MDRQMGVGDQQQRTWHRGEKSHLFSDMLNFCGPVKNVCAII